MIKDINEHIVKDKALKLHEHRGGDHDVQVLIHLYLGQTCRL